MFFDITLRDLIYVLAVAEHHSFSQAAAACAVSQPALSKQIKSVEKSLGLQLFERNKRNVFVTDTGAAFLEQAQKVVDEAEALMTMASAYQEPLSCPIRLGVIASACPYLLPHFVSQLKTAYPALQLIVKEGLTDDLVQELKQGMLDVVIAATTFEEDVLDHIPLYFEPFRLAFNESSGFNLRSGVTVNDFDTSRLLLLEDGHCLKDQTMDLCAISEGQSVVNFKATSLETLLHMTAGGLGMAVIPELAVPADGKFSKELRFVPFKDKRHGRTMALYFRKTFARRNDVAQLAEFIRSHVPSSVSPL